VNGLGGIMQAVSKSAERVGFARIAPLAALLITISNLGALGAWLAVSARLPFVAGLDRYLPPAFARIHPKWGTPHVALLVQAFCGVIFILLSQAGTSVYGAYEVLVSMGIISYFIPYLFVFAALIRFQREPASPEVIRIPGGKPAAIALGTLGFTTTLAAIIFSVVPTAEEAHKFLAVAKIAGMTLALLAVGVVAFLWGKSRNRLND
jgi:glutamate:GABA antiporter